MANVSETGIKCKLLSVQERWALPTGWMLLQMFFGVVGGGGAKEVNLKNMAVIISLKYDVQYPIYK
jgi:hypothetical protein